MDRSQELINPFVPETTESARICICVLHMYMICITVVIDIIMAVVYNSWASSYRRRTLLFGKLGLTKFITTQITTAVHLVYFWEEEFYDVMA